MVQGEDRRKKEALKSGKLFSGGSVRVASGAACAGLDLPLHFSSNYRCVRVYSFCCIYCFVILFEERRVEAGRKRETREREREKARGRWRHRRTF